MARIRTIKPDFWRDEKLSTISAEAALLAIGLLNHADDDGYFNANIKLIEADVFPLRELSRSCTVLLRELHSIGYITLFSGTDDKRYGKIVNFEKHQVINKKNASKIKPLIGLQEDYRSDTVALPVGMEKEKEGKGKERNLSSAVGTVNMFDEIRQAYPKRGGSQKWGDAEKAYKKRLAQKHTHEEILAGVNRYKDYLIATGSIGTQYVQQAATFLGENKGFLEPWIPPVAVKDIRQLSAPERVRLAMGQSDDRIINHEPVINTFDLTKLVR